MVVHAGVALSIDADAQIDFAGPGDEDAEVGSEQHVGEASGGVAGLNGAAVERHHERGGVGIDVGAVLGQPEGGGGAEAEFAAAGEREAGGAVPGGDAAIVDDGGLTVIDVEATGDGYSVDRDQGDGLGLLGKAGERGEGEGRVEGERGQSSLKAFLAGMELAGAKAR